jgi:hypothetical protein
MAPVAGSTSQYGLHAPSITPTVPPQKYPALQHPEDAAKHWQFLHESPPSVPSTQPTEQWFGSFRQEVSPATQHKSSPDGATSDTSDTSDTTSRENERSAASVAAAGTCGCMEAAGGARRCSSSSRRAAAAGREEEEEEEESSMVW